MERAISRIWQEVFHLEQVSVEDNFFDLGAHSLLMVRLHVRLCEELKLQIADCSSVRASEHPSIGAAYQPAVEQPRRVFRDAEPRSATERGPGPIPAASEEIELSMNDPRVEGIAIIGVTGRFPGAGSVEEFWANLSLGRGNHFLFQGRRIGGLRPGRGSAQANAGTTFRHAAC